jgi:hypothetical protein
VPLALLYIFPFAYRWKSVASYVASSAPDQAQKGRTATKLKIQKTNKMGNFHQIPKP